LAEPPGAAAGDRLGGDDGHVSLEPLVYFLIIFMWTPPHFWALALFTREDYARVGIPMMPNVAGDASTRRQILVYSRPARADRSASLSCSAMPGRSTESRRSSSGPSSCGAQLCSGDRPMRTTTAPPSASSAIRSLYLFGLFGVRLAEAVAAGLLGA
jgi:hypothetical protein